MQRKITERGRSLRIPAAGFLKNIFRRKASGDPGGSREAAAAGDGPRREDATFGRDRARHADPSGGRSERGKPGRTADGAPFLIAGGQV